MPSSFSRVLLAMVWLAALSTQAQAQDLPTVQLETVEPQDIVSDVALNGTVVALRSSGLSAAVAGLLETRQVDVGDTVEAGAVLMALDPELANWELESARAETREGEARLSEARRRLQEAQSVGAGRNIAATEVSARESEVAAAEASLARLQAEQQRLATLLNRHKVRAPFDGVVTERLRDLGEWVTPGDELLRVVDTRDVRLDFQVPQSYFPRLGDSSRLLVQTTRGYEPVAIVTRVPVNDPTARTFLLRAEAPADYPLLPGMAVQANLQVATGQQGLTISRDAINRYPEGRVTVWIAEQDGSDTFKVTEKRVQLGARFEGRVEITEGLEQGQQVVVRGNENLSEGVTVTLAEREAR
ncbi:MAG: efflux RND transporter periplasmic adaptor subunit [Pseudomonadota bacterium]|nr:efflux RND transporter periplasmic adaptor subunit [Pseudomonadota bacterium]